MIFFAKRSILDVWQDSEYSFAQPICSTRLRPSLIQESPIQKVVIKAFVMICLWFPNFLSYLLFKNVILTFTHLLSFWRWDSVKYSLAWANFKTHDFYVKSWVKWVVNASQCQVMKLKLLLWEKGSERGRDRIMEKRNKYFNFHWIP